MFDREEFCKRLRRLVEAPSVSMDPLHFRDGIAAAAAEGAELLVDLGGTAEIVATSGCPVVLGRLEPPPGVAPAARVLVYNHLDVQPAAAGQDGWTREPFQFEVVGDLVYGRGTTDDKGPAVTAALAARSAIDAGIPIEVVFAWELEEEIGSPNFAEFVDARRDDLRSDCVVVSDTIWLSKEVPAIPLALRGMITFEMRLRTAAKEAHSGLTGGAARNPVAELAAVAAACADARTGEITIPGMDETWSPPSRAEIAAYVEAGFSTARFRTAHLLELLRAEEPGEVAARIWARPTFELHSIAGGYQGPGVKTSIAPQASAKLSMRLVSPQDPERVLDLVRAHVADLNPDVEILPEGCLAPFQTDASHPYVGAAADAIEEAFGRRPVFTREGGSIGAVVTLEQALRVPILLLGLSLPDDSYHGPDEHFDLRQAAGGMQMFAGLFRRLAHRVEASTPPRTAASAGQPLPRPGSRRSDPSQSRSPSPEVQPRPSSTRSPPRKRGSSPGRGS